MENKSESRKCFEDGKFAVQGIMAGMATEPNPQIVDAVRKITEGANKVENKNAIYNDDVERIVNNPERQEAVNAFHEKRVAKRQRKMLIDACVYAAIALAFGLLGCVGWMTPYIALPVCGIGGLYSAFRFGRWFENGKCWGWR